MITVNSSWEEIRTIDLPKLRTRLTDLVSTRWDWDTKESGTELGEWIGKIKSANRKLWKALDLNSRPNSILRGKLCHK